MDYLHFYIRSPGVDLARELIEVSIDGVLTTERSAAISWGKDDLSHRWDRELFHYTGLQFGRTTSSMTDDEDSEYPSDQLSVIERRHEFFNPVEGEFVEEKRIRGPHHFEDAKNIHSHLIDALNEAKQREKDRKKKALTQKERVVLLEFFTVSHAIIEKSSTNILRFELFDLTEHGDLSLALIRDMLDQSRREELLFEAGLIDAGLKGNMKQVRNTRNQLVHERVSRYLVSNINKLIADADRVIKVIDRLDDVFDKVDSVDNE